MWQEGPKWLKDKAVFDRYVSNVHSMLDNVPEIKVDKTCIMASGYAYFGGFWKIFEIARESGRIDFGNFSFDPTVRHSWFSTLVGDFKRTFQSCATVSKERFCPNCRDARLGDSSLTSFHVFGCPDAGPLGQYPDMVSRAVYEDPHLLDQSLETIESDDSNIVRDNDVIFDRYIDNVIAQPDLLDDTTWMKTGCTI
ncbi:hypothetical protein U1Q18_050851 [Sarracenia purpurea var. burkii]